MDFKVRKPREYGPCRCECAHCDIGYHCKRTHYGCYWHLSDEEFYKDHPEERPEKFETDEMEAEALLK